MHIITTLIAFILLVIIAVAIVMIVRKNKKESFDPSLQYNIDHPLRRQIMQKSMMGVDPPPPTPASINAVRKQLNDWYNGAVAAGTLKPMDKWGKISIDAALDSITMGNWPIGNVLCYMPEGTEGDPTQWIEILRGGNRFFTRNPNDILSITGAVPRLDSHAHGEMVVLDAFEDRLTRGLYDKTSPNYSLPPSSPIDFRQKNAIVGYNTPDNIVLFTQLNSCQMCLSRIGNAGISRCYWLAPDTAGGLAHHLCDSVPAYFQMLNRQVHGVADVSEELIQFAFQAFAGPDSAWVTYCTWKLGQIGATKNLQADYGYCKGQYYANNVLGQNTVWDPTGFFRTVDLSHGPFLNCTVTPPNTPS